MDSTTVNAYDSRAANFAARYASADMTELHHLLLRYLPPACRVLEIGCGSGRDAAFLVENGFTVTATDASKAMIEQAKLAYPRLADSGKTEFLVKAFPLPINDPVLPRKFDAAIGLAVVMHVPDQELFEFAFQVRQLLNPGGTLILSISENRTLPSESTADNPRDAQGRLFRERPPAEIALLFERLGFQLVAREEAADGLHRNELHWTTLVLRQHARGTRPVDQIETIINRDKKDATYKLALLRALCDIAQTANQHVRWHAGDIVSVPLGLVAERWLYYYWPLIDTGGVLIPQKRGMEKNKPLAFREKLVLLTTHFQNCGGLSAFHAAFQSEKLDETACCLTDGVLNAIANTIVVGPVTYASQGDFSAVGPHTARHRCATPSGLLDALGRIHFRADVWRELCLVGHWIGEAILLRWAELTHELAGKQIPVHLVLEKLLIRPETERDVQAVRKLFQAVTGLVCVWTEKPLHGKAFDMDHVIPFVLWHNNDLWNLLPADPNVNNNKRDKLVTRDTLLTSQERIITYWQRTRHEMPRRFDTELNRTLLGHNFAETNWESPAFSALVEAVETTACQRGIERWEPRMTTQAGHRTGSVADSAIIATVPMPKTMPSRVERLILVPFADLGKSEPFTTALPVVGNLAAGTLRAGFETGSLTAVEECDWIKVPAKFTAKNRFVVRIAGDSMEPTLHVGDFAIFEYHRTPRQDGQIVIVAEFADGNETGQVAVKRFRADPTKWVFTSDNIAYPAIRIPKSDQSHPILGVMICCLDHDLKTLPESEPAI